MFDDGRYEKSAPGDFYIELLEYDDKKVCCGAGGIPAYAAPAFCSQEKIRDEYFCFIHKQPKTDIEIYQLLRAAWNSEHECLKYCGQDKKILDRFHEMGLERLCNDADGDHTEQKFILRNICSFKYKSMNLNSDLAEQLRKYLLRNSFKDSKQATELKKINKQEIEFHYTWTAGDWRKRLKTYEGPIYHQISLSSTNDGSHEFRIHHSRDEKKRGALGLTLYIDGFLRELESVENIHWYSEAEWNDGEPTFWRSTPY